MNRSTRIYVAGHAGLVGSAIVRCLEVGDFSNIIVRSHSELDLTEQAATRNFFHEEKPEVVILAAAKVGGINANNVLPATFAQTNLAIQTNVIHEAYKAGVTNLLFLGSSCIYPRDSHQPIRECDLLSGPLELTNRSYAVAKIAGIEMCWAYNRQYGTRYISVMPTNLYGIGDSYDLQTAHVLPASIRKIHEANREKKSTFQAWGTGEVWREFLYSDDMAEACLLLLNIEREKLDFIISLEHPPLINVGSGQEMKVRDLVELVAEVIDFKGSVEWDTTQPSGTPRKLLDSTRIESLGWKPHTSLTAGIQAAYDDFCGRYSQ